MKTLTIRYQFTLADGSQEVCEVQLDPQNLDLLTDPPRTGPPWTHLPFHQCTNCPLTIRSHPSCPLALQLFHIVERFDHLLSFDQMHVEVVTEERSVSQFTTVQKGIGSLMGLIIATCGCPHASFFKPMARFHLPLATGEETLYRATSMYLLAQYFVRKEGRQADLELEGLARIYRNIHIVNTAIAERLRAAAERDSTVNAIVMLDIYALALPRAIEESLQDIRYLFTPFLAASETS